MPFRYGKGLPERARSHTGKFRVVSSAGFIDSHDHALTHGATVVVGRKGSIGTVFYCPEPVFPIDTTFYVEGSDQVDARFAFYLLSSLPLSQMNNDSAVPGLNRTHAENLEILLPPIGDQRAIAATLGVLDDKIESNQRKISILESLGEAHLQSRLTFDKAGFPRFLDDVRLGDILTVLETGSRPKGGIVAEEVGIVSLGAESIQSAGVISTSQFKRVSKVFADSMKRGHLEDMDVLVYKDGGRPGNFVPHVSAFGQGFPTATATINEHVYRVRSGSGISQGLLYWLLRSSWMDHEMRKRGTGVAIPGLNSSNFRDLPIPWMSQTTMNELNELLLPLLSLILRIAAQNMKLVNLRSVLLPELIEGRILVDGPREVGV